MHLGRSTWARALGLLVVVVLLVGACGGGRTVAFASDVPTTPGAESYEGEVESVLDTRLSSISTQRKLRVVDSRVELLPAGVDFATHRTWRDDHAASLKRVDDRSIPEPDAPVLVAEWRGGGNVLLVIGRATAARDRLVVLTALLRS